MRTHNSRHSSPSAWETFSSNARSQTALGYLKVEGLRIKYGGALTLKRVPPTSLGQLLHMHERYFQHRLQHQRNGWL